MNADRFVARAPKAHHHVVAVVGPAHSAASQCVARGAASARANATVPATVRGNSARRRANASDTRRLQPHDRMTRNQCAASARFTTAPRRFERRRQQCSRCALRELISQYRLSQHKSTLRIRLRGLLVIAIADRDGPKQSETFSSASEVARVARGPWPHPNVVRRIDRCAATNVVRIRGWHSRPWRYERVRDRDDDWRRGSSSGLCAVMTAAVVYVAQSKSGVVKIGMSRDPQRRVMVLRAFGEPFALIATSNWFSLDRHAFDAETMTHRSLVDSRANLRGLPGREWFWPTVDVRRVAQAWGGELKLVSAWQIRAAQRRWLHGNANWRVRTSKLSLGEVSVIRRRYERGDHLEQIARAFRITRGNAWKIVRCKTWLRASHFPLK